MVERAAPLADARRGMLAVLRKRVVPALREMGFEGRYPNFYRVRGGHVDLLDFQFSRGGGEFAVNLAFAARSRANLRPDQRGLPPEALRVGSRIDAPDYWRRLGAIRGDRWFRYAKLIEQHEAERPEDIADTVVGLLASNAEPWWEQMRAEHSPDAAEAVVGPLRRLWGRLGGRGGR